MVARSTTKRRHHRAAVKARGEACHICGHEIDYSASHLSPGEFVIDHVVPLSKGGSDVLDNIRPAHRACNRAKGDKASYRVGREPVRLVRVREY